MNVLIIGSGGREHALAWKLSQSPKVTAIFAAPGNPGMEKIARLAPLRANGELDEIVEFALKESVGLVVVGPEAPLALGLADRLTERGIPCFGPGAKGARLESSKSYARDFMKRHGIPSPDWRSFSAPGEAKRYLETLPDAPVVVKADGLAQGKGVVVAANRAEALSAVDETMGGRFGEAGREILIEECLTGEEVSLLTFTDGKTILPMLPVQDHKRIGDGDIGPNTGGMGTYAPVSAFSEAVARTIDDAILRPLRAALRTEGLDYRGCLYVGLMLTPDGPRVIEFNARFGDPETQVLMPLLESDLFDILYACAAGRIEEADTPKWSGESAVCVVMASQGYPGGYAAGRVITESPVPETLARDSWVFHAGTARDVRGDLTTAGGRVLGVTARGKTLEEAIERAYARVDCIAFQGRTFRRDIAHRELARRRMREHPGKKV
jgi:phosphoribosylamine--glycine ligase